MKVIRVKVNFKKPTVTLTTDEYSSMLKEMEDMRHDLALYRDWHAEDQSKILDLIASRDEYEIQVAALRAQAECAEKRAEDAAYKLGDAKQTIANLQEFRREQGQEVDAANRTIAEMATELTELKANHDIASKAISELAELLVTAQQERDEARTEAANLNLELMERDARIDELERRIGWLENRSSDMLLLSGSPFADKNLY